MAHIVEGTVKYKRVTCNACGATIEYLPEEVQQHQGRDIDGDLSGSDYVKCPRKKCPGEGIIRSW